MADQREREPVFGLCKIGCANIIQFTRGVELVNLRSYMSRLGRADGHSDGDEINGRQRAGAVQLLAQLLLMTETVVSEIADIYDTCIWR